MRAVNQIQVNKESKREDVQEHVGVGGRAPDFARKG